jgi:hypothetical protein
MKISEITIGERFRKDLGNLAELADSIKAEGLLQPIGVTAECELVFGYRRLLACREQLGWSEIDTRTVDVSSIVAGEYAENEIRKAFTLSERVAIMGAIKKEIGDRQSQGRPPLSRDNCPHLSGKTQDIAAKRAGFGSGKTARRAELAVEQAGPELAELMDKGEISVDAAYQISRLQKDEQAKRVNEAKAAGKKLMGKGHPQGAGKKPQEKIVVPYTKMEWPTAEEIGRPKFGTPGHAEHVERYGRTPLHPTKVKDLLIAEGLAGAYVAAINSVSNLQHPKPDAFFECIDQLLAHVPQKEKRNGEERDFARFAKQWLQILRKSLPTTIARLTELQNALVVYDSQVARTAKS